MVAFRGGPLAAEVVPQQLLVETTENGGRKTIDLACLIG
jgi:hypothetical protein